MPALGSAAFKTEANKRFTGEALAVSIRMRDSANALVILSDAENFVSISPLIRKRERRFGIVESGSVVARFAHDRLAFNPNAPAFVEPTAESIVFLWADVRIGFPILDEWITLANGKIARSFIDADGVAEITIRDAAVDLLRYKLPRDRAWTLTGWASDIYTVKIAASTATITNNHILNATWPALLGDYTYEFVFTAPTTFDLLHIDEPAYNQTALSSLVPQQIMRLGVLPVVDIPASVWSGTYAAGDTFRLYTSQKYSASGLNPATILQSVITQLGTIKNVSSGFFVSPVVDGALSSWATVTTRFAGQTIEGIWDKDTPLIELVQTILVAIQASVYPSGDGKLAIYHFHPDDAGTATKWISGDPNHDFASILEATRTEDTGDRATRAVFSYKTVGTGTIGKVRAGSVDAQFEALDLTTILAYDSPFEMNGGLWELPSALVESATNQSRDRFSTTFPRYHVKATLYDLLSHDLSEMILVSEPGLSETFTKIAISQIAVQAMENTVEAIGFVDATVDTAFARLDVTNVGDADVIF